MATTRKAAATVGPVTATLKFTKATKNTYRFDSDNDGPVDADGKPVALPTVYVHKSAFGDQSVGEGSTLTVTLQVS